MKHPETYVAGESVLQLGDGVGHGHRCRSRGEAEVRVLGADPELDGWDGEDAFDMDVHSINGRDGALEALHSFGTLAVLQRALVSDRPGFVLFALLWPCVRILYEAGLR